MLGQPIILLHDRDTIRDILTKSSKIASSRPSFTFADMCGFGGLLNLLSKLRTLNLTAFFETLLKTHLACSSTLSPKRAPSFFASRMVIASLQAASTHWSI
ncbi:hypothetical protein GGP41_003140 [Bipolaris sorokiniana]|uniref:Uncharacterized protein n=1 Tax=Cochliobolus sativus TaxID=45130 RepID=A0A8H6DRU1_COCSA|nr:hypothetical protein GGP41_003140 [Bipolaris sorokiniana]